MSSTHPIVIEGDAPTLRVMSLHALTYCERLFYLEEIEELRVADEAVWEGRRLHEELDEQGELVEVTVASQALGLRGRLDAVRRRDGTWYPIEHKRGRARRDEQGTACAWDSDQVQAIAYALLLEEHTGQPVTEARVRYHQDRVTVRVPITQAARDRVHEAIARASSLRTSTERPDVTPHEGRCNRCSLAPVCLPEEARLAASLHRGEEGSALRLFPADTERRSMHIVEQGARLGTRRGKLRVTKGGETLQEVGVSQTSDVVVHGYGQVSTQCLRRCASMDIPVHWVTQGGAYAGSFFGPTISVQRKLRQYEGLRDDARRHELARRLVVAKIDHQLRHVLRASRGDDARREAIDAPLAGIRRALASAKREAATPSLLGHEGRAARWYFACLGELVREDVAPGMQPTGRTRRPPEDPFNALLSFLYALLYRDVLAAIMTVGLEPAMGLLHQPRSAAPPLALDLTELFRVPVVDMAVLGAVHRQSFDAEQDFTRAGSRVWLSDTGRRKAIALYERRKHEEYRHPVLAYSLSYARMMELEVRLLEKEWSGEPGLFATFRFR